MIVVVFRSRLKPGIEKEVEETDARMAKLAAAMPGYVSYSQYASADGEEVAVVEFESHETAAARGACIPSIAKHSGSAGSGGSPSSGLPSATWRETTRSRRDSMYRRQATPT
jgi:hypothetical protein